MNSSAGFRANAERGAVTKGAEHYGPHDMLPHDRHLCEHCHTGTLTGMGTCTRCYRKKCVRCGGLLFLDQSVHKLGLGRMEHLHCHPANSVLT